MPIPTYTYSPSVSYNQTDGTLDISFRTSFTIQPPASQDMLIWIRTNPVIIVFRDEAMNRMWTTKIGDVTPDAHIAFEVIGVRLRIRKVDSDDVTNGPTRILAVGVAAHAAVLGVVCMRSMEVTYREHSDVVNPVVCIGPEVPSQPASLSTTQNVPDCVRQYIDNINSRTTPKRGVKCVSAHLNSAVVPLTAWFRGNVDLSRTQNLWNELALECVDINGNPYPCANLYDNLDGTEPRIYLTNPSAVFANWVFRIVQASDHRLYVTPEIEFRVRIKVPSGRIYWYRVISPGTDYGYSDFFPEMYDAWRCADDIEPSEPVNPSICNDVSVAQSAYFLAWTHRVLQELWVSNPDLGCLFVYDGTYYCRPTR